MASAQQPERRRPPRRKHGGERAAAHEADPAEAEHEAELADAEAERSPGEKRLRSYIAAQAQLRSALEVERTLDDDGQATRLLLDAGRRTLNYLELLASNDDLWEKLASTDVRPLEPDEIDQLEYLADGGLAGLLEALDYQEPPPAIELVDEMLRAVALAQARHEDPVRASWRVARARRELSLLTIRLRRLVGSVDASMPPSLARRILRGVDRELEGVLTATAPELIHAGADALFPGAGLVTKVGAAIGGVIAGRVLSLRPHLEVEAPEAVEPWHIAIERAYRAAARFAGQAVVVDALASSGTREGPAHDLAIAQAWVVDEAIRQALEADPGDTGRAARLRPAAIALRTARFNIILGRPLAHLAEIVEGAIDEERLGEALDDLAEDEP